MTPEEQRQKCKKLIKELKGLQRAYEKFMKKYQDKKLAVETELRGIQKSCAHESHRTHKPDICPDCFENFRENESYG